MLDFIQFINDNVSLSVAKKTALLTDFCKQYSYQETITDEEGNEVPNPTTKQQFANQKFVDFVVQTVNAQRKRSAESAVEFEELVLE